MNETSSELIQMGDWLSIAITLAAVFIPLAGAVVLWWLNQRSRLKWEMQIQKEKRYRAFLKSIRGFYVSSQNREEKERFLLELRLAWLYCPDDVIKAGYAFLDTVAIGANCSDEEKEQALASFELALRKDIHVKTNFTERDHRILSGT